MFQTIMFFTSFKENFIVVQTSSSQLSKTSLFTIRFYLDEFLKCLCTQIKIIIIGEICLLNNVLNNDFTKNI